MDFSHWKLSRERSRLKRTPTSDETNMKAIQVTPTATSSSRSILHILLFTFFAFVIVPVVMAGKPDGKGGGSGGDGGGDPPPATVPFRYELTWLPNPTLDAAGNGFYVYPRGINAQGVTVGTYYSYYDDFSQRSGFMATAETGLVDLNDVIQQPGYTIIGGGWINDSGVIVGQALNDVTGNPMIYRYYVSDEGETVFEEILANAQSLSRFAANELGDVAYQLSGQNEVRIDRIDGTVVPPTTIPTGSFLADIGLGNILVTDDSACYRITSGTNQADVFSGYSGNCMNLLGEIGAEGTMGKYKGAAVRLDESGVRTAITVVNSNPNGINTSGDIVGRFANSGYYPFLDTIDLGFLDLDPLLLSDVGSLEKWDGAANRTAISLSERVNVELADGTIISLPLICGRALVAGGIGEVQVIEGFILKPVPAP
jgi:hypothetical protein